MVLSMDLIAGTRRRRLVGKESIVALAGPTSQPYQHQQITRCGTDLGSQPAQTWQGFDLPEHKTFIKPLYGSRMECI